MKKIRILNGFAGVGANLKMLNRDVYDVTHVELEENIAEKLREVNPNDDVVVGDVFQYLQLNHDSYDAFWFSPPCQEHTKMVLATRHVVNRIPNLRGIYGIQLFLNRFTSKPWVVENVIPWYDPLISPTAKIGRHLFWSNKKLSNINDVKRPSGFINKTNTEGAEALKKWLGINYRGNIYYKGNHCPAQVLRNCVHPKIGKQIVEQLLAE
jgi:DNA (cytosine-5)-methyltransferase 1